MNVELNDAIIQLIKYIDDNYLQPDSPFPPSMWASLITEPYTPTNNGAEAFHRHFGDLFGYLKSNPNIYHFIKTLQEYKSFKKVKLNSVKSLHEPTLKIFQQDHNHLREDSLDISEFLSKVYKTMLPVNT